MAILPGLALFAAAVGKISGAVIPTTGTRSEPTRAATTTRATFTRKFRFICLKSNENMLSTRPLMAGLE